MLIPLPESVRLNAGKWPGMQTAYNLWLVGRRVVKVASWQPDFRSGQSVPAPLTPE